MSERLIEIEPGICLSTDTDQPDEMIINEIWKLNRYQILFPKREIAPSILDIGAYKGYFAVMCATRGARVQAFEPSPNSYRKLWENGLRSHDAREASGGRMGIHRYAVWKEETQLHLHRHPTSHGCDTLINGDICRGDCGYPGPMVPCVPFDEVVGDTHWAFVKMDCEGAEYEILLNASDKSLSQIDQIAIELHGPQKLKDRLFGPFLSKLTEFFKIETLVDVEEAQVYHHNGWKYLYGIRR